MRFPRTLPVLRFRMSALFSSIASSLQSIRPEVDAAAITRLARDPESVWGCDSGAGRFGCGLHQSFEAVRRHSRTGGQIHPRVCTRRAGRSITWRRSAERREALTQVCHRPAASLSNPVTTGNLPPITAKNLCRCTENRRCTSGTLLFRELAMSVLTTRFLETR